MSQASVAQDRRHSQPQSSFERAQQSQGSTLKGSSRAFFDTPASGTKATRKCMALKRDEVETT